MRCFVLKSGGGRLCNPPPIAHHPADSKNRYPEEHIMTYRSADHHLVKAVAWVPENDAETINDHTFMSRSTSNSYLITTSAGDVVINAGMPYQGKRHRERFEQLIGRPLSVSKLIFTQSHPDHMAGWNAFNDPGVELIAQQRFF